MRIVAFLIAIVALVLAPQSASASEPIQDCVTVLNALP